jgi:hypothetical protein
MARFGKIIGLQVPLFLGVLASLFAAYGPAGTQAAAVQNRQAPAGSSGPLRPTKIVWYSEPAGRRVTVRVAGGYCVGEKPPAIARIRIQEKPARRGQTGKAIVTVFLSGEEAHEPGTVTGGERAPGQANLCFGVEEQIDSTITFKRPVERLRIFDGSADPPRPVALRHPG